MNKIVRFFQLVGLLSFFYLPTNAQNPHEKEIVQMLSNQQKAWNAGDIEGYMRHGYWESDSLVFIGSQGPKFGFKTALRQYKKGYPDRRSMGTLQFSNLSFQQLNLEIYLISGHWALNREDQDLSGYFTLIVKKINGEWRIIYDHTS